MSRTIRRKNKYNIDEYLYHDKQENEYDEINTTFKYFYNYKEYNRLFSGTYNFKNNKKIYKDIQLYHSDKYNCNAPKYFRKQYNKKYRLKCKKIINNINDYNNIIFPLNKNNINWDWF
jgi:hypothetical protein